MPKYHVDRSVEIDATPQHVFDVVSDFTTWPTWSPWLLAEPEAQVKVSDDPKSVGSLYSWLGEVTGQGELEHRKLEPGRLIECEIRFAKPFKSVSAVSFDLESVGQGTRLTWNMDGSLPFFMFWMRSLMESLIGMDYVRGLRMVKEWIETNEIQSKTNVKGVQSTNGIRVVGVPRTTEMNDISDAMDSAFAEAEAKLAAAGISTECEMVSVYKDFNLKTQVMNFIAGFAVSASESLADGSGLMEWSAPAGQAFVVEHIGKYEHLGNGWSAANQHVRYKKLKQSKLGTYEIYRNNPSDTAPHDLITDIFLPLK